MKKTFLFMVIMLLSGSLLFSQVAVNTDGSTPNSSAMLDVKSITKGFLPPRMSRAELNAVADPADGLVVYCTNCGPNGSGALSLYMAGKWYILSTNCMGPLSPSAGAHVASSTQIEWKWNVVPDAMGYKWNITDDFYSALDMGATTSYTETDLTCNTPYLRYVWALSECGLSEATILSKATSGGAVDAPTAGVHWAMVQMITWNWNTVADATGYRWNTIDDFASAIDKGTSTSNQEFGLTCNTPYTRFAWAYSACGNSTAVTLTKSTSSILMPAPEAGTSIPSPNQIVWNWNTVLGATGYKWNTTNDYATATDMVAATTKIETNLTCNTPYTRYVWAYSQCGISIATILSQTTSGGSVNAPTAGVHWAMVQMITWNWNTVADATGYKWNTTDDFASAIDKGTSTSNQEFGLTCNTPYTRFAWAYSTCGNSTAVTLTKSTTSNPPLAPTAGTHVPEATQIEWNWNTVSGATGYKWNTTNDYATATDMVAAMSKTETALTCNTSYTRYVWSYSDCGVSTATILNQTTLACNTPGMPCPGIPTVLLGEKSYNTVQIGTQCWFKENLDIGTMIISGPTNNGIIEKYCWNNLLSNCDTYGGLYNWSEMMEYVPTAGGQGICPPGWHIPTEGEWAILTTYLGGPDVAGGKIKSTGTIQATSGLWNQPNTGATNESGFSAVPAGERNLSNGLFYSKDLVGAFWSSTMTYDYFAWFYRVFYNNTQLNFDYYGLPNGFSARCLKNAN